jgi:hypothetical protein
MRTPLLKGNQVTTGKLLVTLPSTSSPGNLQPLPVACSLTTAKDSQDKGKKQRQKP